MRFVISSTDILQFIVCKIHGPREQYLFFFYFCTPKLHERMFCSLVQMMLVGSSTKILHSIIIRKKYSLNKQMAMFAVI